MRLPARRPSARSAGVRAQQVCALRRVRTALGRGEVRVGVMNTGAKFWLEIAVSLSVSASLKRNRSKAEILWGGPVLVNLTFYIST